MDVLPSATVCTSEVVDDSMKMSIGANLLQIMQFN
jgi:hypothetical protein